jgi:hypothetical protein
MKKLLLSTAISTGLLFSTAAPVMATQPYHAQHQYNQQSYKEYRHHQHMRTLKHVGIGAGAGAVVGGIAGGGAGAAIGGILGGGAGYAYGHFKKHH